MTATEIGKLLGFTKSQIDGKIAKLNLDKKKRNTNIDYFSKIDTPLKAYFLGFIYADGYIIYNQNNGNYEFGMCLQSKDKYVLEKLNDELGGENIIYHQNPHEVIMKNYNNKIIHSGHADTLRVYSKYLVEDLIKLGVVQNKSKQEIFPIVDDTYFFDFLRGYIDGDGCFYTDNNKTYMHITSATTSLFKYIQRKLNDFNINTRIYCENENKYRLMCVNTNDMSKLVNHLYYMDDLFYLTRKYEKIKHFISFAI